MAKKKKHHIKFYVKEVPVRNKDATRPQFHTNRVQCNSIKTYANMAHRIGKCSPCAIYLFHYLTTKSDELDSTVFNSVYHRGLFIKFAKKNCGKKYVDETVKKAFYKLRDNHLLIGFKARGMFILNPVNVFQGKEEKRADQILTLCHQAIKTDGQLGVKMRKALGLPADLKADVMEY
jgi:hypothetical protein